MIYYQSVHKNFEDKKKKKRISNLICFFSIFQISLFGRITLSRSFFIQINIFEKKLLLFLIVFKHRTSSSQFFLPIFVWHSKYFFEKNEYDTHLFNFSFFIQNKLSSYFEKEKERKSFFCIFSEIKNTFFVLTSKSQFFEFWWHHKIY